MIHCGKCNHEFEIKHPALHTRERLRQVTMTCLGCGTILTCPPNDVVYMVPVQFERPMLRLVQ